MSNLYWKSKIKDTSVKIKSMSTNKRCKMGDIKHNTNLNKRDHTVNVTEKTDTRMFLVQCPKSLNA